MICECCGAEMSGRTTESCHINECPNCGASIVTTYFEPIYLDRTNYAISIQAGNAVDKDVLTAIGKVAGVNFLKAKAMAEQGEENIYEAMAPMILDKKRILDGAGVSYSIEPKFPY